MDKIPSNFTERLTVDGCKAAHNVWLPIGNLLMNQRAQRWIDLTGLNLIRVVVGSYFMALSLGLVTGLKPYALFPESTEPRLADLVGSTFLFAITAAFMIGFQLRLAALTLALFILCNSITQNFLKTDSLNFSAFWADLTMICAVLMCYFSLKRHEFSRAMVVWRRKTFQTLPDRTMPVRPRRIVKAKSRKFPKRSEPKEDPLFSELLMTSHSERDNSCVSDTTETSGGQTERSSSKRGKEDIPQPLRPGFLFRAPQTPSVVSFAGEKDVSSTRTEDEDDDDTEILNVFANI